MTTNSSIRVKAELRLTAEGTEIFLRGDNPPPDKIESAGLKQAWGTDELPSYLNASVLNFITRSPLLMLVCTCLYIKTIFFTEWIF